MSIYFYCCCLLRWNKLYYVFNYAADDKTQAALTSTISVKVPISVFFQLLFYYHLVTHYFHKFSAFGALLAPAADRGPQMPWWVQQIRHFMMSPLLLTAPTEWFLAMEKCSTLLQEVLCCLLRQCSCTKMHLVYRVFCFCSVVVPNGKEHYSHHQSFSLELFCAAFVFHREVLQLVVHECCYCRSSCDAWVRNVWNSLVVTISFLKITDGKWIHPWSLAWSPSSCLGKHKERKHLCVPGGEGPLRPFTRTQIG